MHKKNITNIKSICEQKIYWNLKERGVFTEK
jgi:hypothetical protein